MHAERRAHHALEATDEAVYLQVAGGIVAYDAADGTELPDGGPPDSPTPPESTGPSQGPVIDGVRIDGGQDDPTTAYDDATGAVLWTQPGSPAYDDVWAVGDGAVVSGRPAGHLRAPAARRLRPRNSGDTRWVIEQDMADELWPWYVDGGVLFALWNNLALISTDDGSTIWRTHYPAVEFPRMTGVRANSDTVFVAFSSIASDGD